MRSISRTLAAWILAGLGVVLVGSGAAVYLAAREGLREQLDESLIARARTFAALVVEEPGTNGAPGPVKLDYVGPLREAELGVRVRITTADGVEVARSPDWPAGAAAPSLKPGEIAAVDGPAAGGHGTRIAAVGVVAAREPDERYEEGLGRRNVVAEVVGGTDDAREAEHAVFWALLAGGILAAVGTGGAVWLGVRRGLAPLRRLKEELAAVDERAPGISTRAESYPEELRPVVGVLGEVLAKLRGAIERERRFTDAAAHELRTPIAELRTLADVAARWPEPERLQRAAVEAGAVAKELESLLEVLLAAARGGDAYAAHKPEEVAVLPLAREIADRERARAGDRVVAWTFTGDEDARWHGPRAAVGAIVRNLVGNAAEYTPEGGTVLVEVRREGAGASLVIENGPVAMRPEDLERLFEPFWRGDVARSDRRHSGMGLFVVDSLAATLGLRREVGMDGADRLRVRLSPGTGAEA